MYLILDSKKNLKLSIRFTILAPKASVLISSSINCRQSWERPKLHICGRTYDLSIIRTHYIITKVTKFDAVSNTKQLRVHMKFNLVWCPRKPNRKLSSQLSPTCMLRAPVKMYPRSISQSSVISLQSLFQHRLRHANFSFTRAAILQSLISVLDHVWSLWPFISATVATIFSTNDREMYDLRI